MSIRSTARLAASKAACATEFRSPTNVMTHRLWLASISWSRTRTPGTDPIAATSPSTTSLRRPSEKLGTHSTISAIEGSERPTKSRFLKTSLRQRTGRLGPRKRKVTRPSSRDHHPGGIGTPRRGGTLVCLVLVGPLVGGVLAAPPVAPPPPIPMRVQGQAFDRLGAPLPIGTPIRAFVDGVDYSNGSSVQSGAGTYRLLIAGNSKTNANVSDTPTGQEGANLGDAVIIAAGDFSTSANVFQKVISWAPRTLVIPKPNPRSTASTPPPPQNQRIVTQPP